MKNDMSKYTIRLQKLRVGIAIYIINKHNLMEESFYTEFNPLLNKHYIFGPLTKFTREILLYHNIIEQINQELSPKFVLTQSALISLL